MYRQHKNAEFVAETLSIMGGLLILFAHLSSAIAQRKRLIDSDAGQEGDRLAAVEIRAKRLGLAGRALLVTLFLFSGWTRAHRFMSNRVYSKYELATWAMVTADAAVGLALVSVCALVVLGMRSRFCALLMAAVNFVTNLWLHPFWLYLFSETTYELPDVMGAGLGEKMSGYKLSAALYASHQRYFFFQSLSYTGALLLLVVHGPGQYSIDEPGARHAVPRRPARSRPRGRRADVCHTCGVRSPFLAVTRAVGSRRARCSCRRRLTPHLCAKCAPLRVGLPPP